MPLIDRDALIAKAYIMQEPNGFIHSVVTERQIVAAPTIDAVPVVRCAKCKHGEFEQENGMWACIRCADYDEDYDMFTGFIEYHNADHFCSYGERRSE